MTLNDTSSVHIGRNGIVRNRRGVSTKQQRSYNNDIAIGEKAPLRETHRRHVYHHRRSWALRVLVLVTLYFAYLPTIVCEDELTKDKTAEKESGKGSDKSDPNTLFEWMDSNHDSSLSLSEFTASYPALREKLRQRVTNNIPKITFAADFWNGFSTSTMMIIATEIGDKTFFIAAVLSMRNSRVSVFLGALLALVCMTVLSTMMGLILPSLLPQSYTHIIAGVLFFYFGIKLIYDSRSMKHQVSDELEEVEEELLSTRKKEDREYHDKDHNDDAVLTTTDTSQHSNPTNHTDIATNDLEANQSTTNNAKPNTTTTTHKPNNSNNSNARSVFLQAFLLTFLAEWGDRSQIATIALAADKHPVGVTLGACFGHALCTGMAVVGGRMLASKISEKTVSFWGGFVFLGFGFHSLFVDV